jgi:hypothetical protein
MRAIGYNTYVKFATEYQISPFTKSDKTRSMRQLARLIYNYETRHKIQNGLYYKDGIFINE